MVLRAKIAQTNQLNHRNIPADGRCVFCGRTERVEHLFLLCPFARAVWSAVKACFPLRLCRKDMINAKQWIFDFLSREKALNSTVLAITCWHIWEARNDVRNNATCLQPERVAVKITAYVDLVMQNCFKFQSKPTKQANLQARSWTPPPEGMLSMCVDAALFPLLRRMGWGAVLRDHDGKVILSCSESLDGCPSPELAESLAVRRALAVLRDRGFRKCTLESDCLSLIQRIVSSAQDRSQVGMIVRDIKTLAAGFESLSFKHISRVFNVTAHQLARASVRLVCNFSPYVSLEFFRAELCSDVF